MRIKRLSGVVVAAHMSAKDRKPALHSAITARVFKRSRVDRARGSSRVTISASPPASCLLSVLSPYATSRNTLPAPAAVRAATWPASLWLVETRAYL